MTIGAIIVPKISPNLIQALFNGVKILESISPNIMKGIDIDIKYIFGLLPLRVGYKPRIKKIIKNNIPKLLLLVLFLSFIIISILSNMKYSYLKY
tara:strand:- start:99 stop:383 length:285 start_codon:yes stop_codon:yes gene_type:complete